MKKKDLWLRFGCFLIGYNYTILSGCSEVAAKSVKRYTSAMMIVSLLWGFIGFTFTERYLKGGIIGSTFGAIIFVLVIIQVERQIILAVQSSRMLYASRIGIALVMSVLGSIVIDQIIFKDDIEQKKLLLMDDKIKAIYPSKAEELIKQISALDSNISAKEQARNRMNDDIMKNPMLKVVNVTRTKQTNLPQYTDTLRNNISSTTTQINTSAIPNPKIDMLKEVDKQIEGLRKVKIAREDSLLTLRPKIERELKSKTGFLDELDVMLSIILGSLAAGIVWLVWFVFLCGLELLILMGKSSGELTDYEILILHQMETNKRKINLLTKKNDSIFESI